MPDNRALRLLVQTKLADGRLPTSDMSHVWGGQARGETCDACGETIPKGQLIIESLAPGGAAALQFHVPCFYLWISAREATRRGANDTGEWT
jgi:hypothetical protein